MLNSDCSNNGNLRLVGDPVDVVTGAVSDLRPDFRRRGPIPIDWNRYYSSDRAKIDGYTGFGFLLEYERSIERDLDGIQYHSPDAGVVPFQDIEVGALDRSQGLLLHRVEPALYSVDAADGLRYFFLFSTNESKAALVKIEDSDENQILFQYDPDGRLKSIVDSLHRTILVKWNSNERIESIVLRSSKDETDESCLVRYDYDHFGNAVRVTDLYDTEQTFEYDLNHRVTKRTDRLGYSFLFTFDSLGRCIHARGEDNFMEVRLEYNPEARTTYVQRADGGRWTYFYSLDGAITQINDPYGNTTQYTIDPHGRTAAEIDPLGNVTTWQYSNSGELLYRIGPHGNILPAQPESPEPPLVHGYTLPTTPMEWEFGRLLNRNAIGAITAENPLLQQLPASVVNACLGIRTTTDPGGGASLKTDQATEFDEDDYDRPTDGADGIEHWKYDPNGNEIEHRDRDGAITRRVYASANLPREEIDPLGHVTRFQQTAQGLASRVEDPGGTVTEYVYDLCDRLTEVRQNGQPVERYVRDSVGNITEKFDRLGNRSVQWIYGPGNLFVERVLNSGERQKFKYDDLGRIVSAKTLAGEMTLKYGADGSVVADKHDGLGVEHSLLGSEIQASIYLGKFKVEYRWSDEGEWVVKDPQGGEHRFQMNEAGLVLKQLANGQREVCQYDADGRCLRKVTFRSGDLTPWMRQYRYSLDGDLLYSEDSTRGKTAIRYDKAHRLLQVSNSQQSIVYVYDAAGNLVQQGEHRSGFSDRNRLVSLDGDRFEYDDCGRISERNGPNTSQRFRYNELGLLTDIELDGQPWKAKYDAYGRRTSKTWKGETTQYYWDDLRLSAEVSQDGRIRLYIYVDHKALVAFMTVDYSNLDADPGDGFVTYLITDQIGTPIQAISERGQARWSGDAAAFGTVNIKKVDGVEQPIRFPGHYADNETGLHYNRFRYYSPEFGRYLQPDPLGQLGGVNLYANPAMPFVSVDIDGLMAKKGQGNSSSAPTKPKPKSKPKNPMGPQTQASSETSAKDPCAVEPAEAARREKVAQEALAAVGVPPNQRGLPPTFDNRHPGAYNPNLKDNGKPAVGQNSAGQPSEPEPRSKNDRGGIALGPGAFSDKPPAGQNIDKAWKDASERDRAIATAQHEKTEKEAVENGKQVGNDAHNHALDNAAEDGKKNKVPPGAQAILDGQKENSPRQ